MGPRCSLSQEIAGYYCINDIDSALVSSVTVRIEQQIIMLDFCFVSDPPVNVTNFNCIIYDWDRSMVCTWDLGVEYKNINNINTTLFMYVCLDETCNHVNNLIYIFLFL